MAQTQKIHETAKLLADLDATVEYPAYIEIELCGLNFAFGHANGDFGYEFSPIGDLSCPKAGEKTLPVESDAKEMAEFVRQTIKIFVTII